MLLISHTDAVHASNFSVTVWVTRELLLDIFNHSLELRIWDSKDKVSARARFDRPKAFRLPAGQESEEDSGNHGGSFNVRALVLNQELSHAQLKPKDSSSRENKGAFLFNYNLRTKSSFEDFNHKTSRLRNSFIFCNLMMYFKLRIRK